MLRPAGRNDTWVAVRRGEHACCRFANTRDRRRLAEAFVLNGLLRGHKVLYLRANGHADLAGELATALAGEGADVEAAIDRGQLDVRAAHDYYIPDGRFDAEHTLAAARRERELARAQGYPALSIAGEMSWLDDALPGGDELREYERRFASLIEDGDMVALCQYDAGAHVPRGMLDDVAAAHDVDLSPELAALGRSGPLSAARVEHGRVLRLAGELDFLSADALATVLDAHFPGPLTVDLADLGFVDVTGLRALRGRHGRTLTIASASDAVRRLLVLLAWDTDPAVMVD